MQSILAGQKFLINGTATDDLNRPLYLIELQNLVNQESAHAIQDLALAEEQIIDNKVAETLDVNNVGVMIDATIASILLDNTKQLPMSESTVSLMPTFLSPDDDEGDMVERMI